MRPACLECVAKHLGKAAVLLDECLLGYPEHIHLVAGNLDEASSEALMVEFKLANEIREARLGLWSAWWEYRTGQLSYPAFKARVPVLMELIEKVDGMLVSSGGDLPEAASESSSRPENALDALERVSMGLPAAAVVAERKRLADAERRKRRRK